jgi:glycosyltransferase involved in cell wall biosynthesis
MHPKSRRRVRAAKADVERDVTIVVKTFERPEALRRLVTSIRRFYPRIPIVVVDDSASPLERSLDHVEMVRLPFRSGVSAGRNAGVAAARTDLVLITDDDMVFTRRTSLERMVDTLRTTPFDLVSCRWFEYDPWRGVARGERRYEGTVDLRDDAYVHTIGASRGEIAGLPVYDITHQFFVFSRNRVGSQLWDERLKVDADHLDLFLALRARQLLSTRLPDVWVDHRPELPPSYQPYREDTREARMYLRQKWGFQRHVQVGDVFRPVDRVRYGLPGAVIWWVRRTARVGRRLLLEGRLRAAQPPRLT